MARRDLSNVDASTHASSQLEYIIRKDSPKPPSTTSVTAEEAMNEERVYELKSDRDITRVLFVSNNTELLNPTQQSLDGYINISDLFDEVHILILREGITTKRPVLRVAKNVWIYTATAKSWWSTISAGMRMVEEQLEFASGFRPDLIVARDPFESALVASKIGRKYGRPTQLHILDDFTNKKFSKRDNHNFWRTLLTRFTIPRFLSVRTQTTSIQHMIEEKYEIKDIATMPRYQNYEALINSDSHFNLKEVHKPFIFFMLHIGYLGENNTLSRVVQATKEVLRNPRVGLVVLGDGPERKVVEKQAKALGVYEQLIFKPEVEDVVPYLKAANILLVSNTDFESEEVVLKGAASGIPMVMTKTEKRSDVFVDGESAFLCDETNVEAFTEAVDKLLNDIDLRKKFVSNAQEIIREQFYDNPSEYMEAYRTSIEQAFFIDGDYDTSPTPT